jgi:hypothetical protein
MPVSEPQGEYVYTWNYRKIINPFSLFLYGSNRRCFFLFFFCLHIIKRKRRGINCGYFIILFKRDYDSTCCWNILKMAIDEEKCKHSLKTNWVIA